MPTYSYQCKECDHSFEKMNSMSNRHLPLSEDCPNCGSNGNIQQTITKVTLGDPVAYGVQKLPSDFRSGILDQVKKMPGAAKRESKFQ